MPEHPASPGGIGWGEVIGMLPALEVLGALFASYALVYALWRFLFGPAGR